ncbi:MAG: TfoX/Sxy family protein, partial [Candidatus Paceibacterota bacterium]
MKTQTNTFQEYVTTDLLRDMPGLSTRRMFSGYGVYQGDIMFGLVVNGMLYFKVGEENRAAFKQYGSKPFFYYRQGKKTELASFWEVPPDI